MAAPRKTKGTSRRGLLKGVLAAGTVGILVPRHARAETDPNWKVAKGRIKQSVVPWCFTYSGEKLEIEALAKHSAEIGLKSVELCKPEEFPILKKYGLTCAILGSHGFVKGFNHVENHESCVAAIRKSVDTAAEFGCPNVITFSGMREKMSDEEGIKNTIDGLKKVIAYAEEKKITLCIEMLNSRVDERMKGHPGYHCDSIEWAVKVCEGVGSPRMKILFDIYHVQIMQGDVITLYKKYKQHVGHIYTAGVPGRAEIDDSQEVNYPGVMKALLEAGYDGFVGQEFIPAKADKIASLRDAARICDV